MEKSKLLKVLQSFEFAISGIRHATQNELSFKIHLFAAALATIIGFYVDLNAYEWYCIILLIGLVLSAELFNTAIEKIVDFISPHQDKRAGAIKDISAGAVLIISLSAFICGILILLPKIISNI